MRWARVLAAVVVVGAVGLVVERRAVDPVAHAEQVVRWVTVQGTNRSPYFPRHVVGGDLAYAALGGKIAQAKKKNGRWRIETKKRGFCRAKAMGQQGIGVLSANGKTCRWGFSTQAGAGLHTTAAGFEVLMKHERLRWVKRRAGKPIARERILGPQQGNARYPLCLGREFHGYWKPAADSSRLRVESRSPGFLKNGKCWFPSTEKQYMKSTSDYWYLRRFDGPLRG